MAQLDRFLSAMVSNRADSIDLIEGAPSVMLKGGVQTPITRAPLTGTQILGLVKEIADPDAAKALEGGGPAVFRYETVDGVFAIRARQDDGKWLANIRIDPHGEFERSTGASAAAAPAASAPAGFSAGAGMPMGAAAAPPSSVTATASHATPAADAPAQGAPNTKPAGAQIDYTWLQVSPERMAQGRAEIDKLLRLLVTRGGSDLHLRVGEPPILRTHGEMVRVDGLPPIDNSTMEAMLLSIMPERNKAEFAEANDSDFAYEIEGVARFRANALRERKGAGAVFRVIPAQVVSVEQMNITQEVQNLCFLTKGLVLVTGPTGSGKSTTLCALIDLVNRSRTDHVITIEDPIEFVHPNKNCIITQRQVSVHTKGFKSALRAALREDPDVILVGELRDLETTSIAIETAETGHLVFGTLHTTTAAGTVDRIIDQFPADRQSQIRVMLSESLKGVVSQVLCRKIGGGRAAAREILLSVPAISNLIREGKTFQIPSVLQTSKKVGMVTLNDALIDLVDKNEVEPKEAYMKAVDKTGFVMMLKGHNHDASFVEGDPGAGAKAAESAAAAAKPGAPAAGGRPMAGARR